MNLQSESEYLYNERERRSGCLAWCVVFVVLVAVFCTCFFSGCKTAEPLVQVREVQVHDTTELHDSVYIDKYRTIYAKGDTIFQHDSVYKYVYKFIDKVQIEVQHDSIPYKVEVTKEVRRRNGYDKATSAGFWSLLALILACVAWKIVKRYYLRL